ncbi:hypothetical protein C8R44DRAFT_774438 [Mycena epipterygia]|nr:hypothetical protein C8R44DRAFT_774438 [Mycena epipterygia]
MSSSQSSVSLACFRLSLHSSTIHKDSASSSGPLTLGDSIPNYVELAALVVPQKKLGIKEKLRRACGYLPMPLSLGWDADAGDEEAPHDSTVPGLLLSDIASGATRLVSARWMHALYKHTMDTQPPGTMVMHLREAGYTTEFRWPHAMILATFLVQLSFVLFAMTHGQRREGWLLLAGGFIRISEGVIAWMYPQYRDPRSDDTVIPRYCALHTGMTTNHILVITHRFGSRGKCVNLEDAATPLRRKSREWKGKLEDSLRAAVKLSVWLQKGASLITSANGYTVPLVLLLGTTAIEFVSASADVLPSTTAFTVLKTGSSVLDRLTAACQFTGSISVGFVESLLPDPRGFHTDYEWISHVMQPESDLDPHPTHPLGRSVLESTLRRRNPIAPRVQRPSAALRG